MRLFISTPITIIPYPWKNFESENSSEISAPLRTLLYFMQTERLADDSLNKLQLFIH